MSDVVYRPGQWQVVVEESGIAALPADASADKVVALSEMLRRGVPELTEVIDVLSGGAITGLGSFAVALIGPTGTRFAVRGAVRVLTGFEEGFSGEDITTWSERFIVDEPRFEIGFGEPADAVAYPIRSGVVLASAVRVGERFEAPVREVGEEHSESVAAPVADAADADVADTDESSVTDASALASDASSEAVSSEDPGALEEDASAPDDESAGSETADDAAGSETADDDADVAPQDTMVGTQELASSIDDEPAAEKPAETAPLPTEDLSTRGDAPTDTMVPEDVAAARGGTADEGPWDPGHDQPDVTATIVPDDQPDLGATVVPPPAPVAVPGAGLAAFPPPAPTPPAPASGLDIGDHDGSTISIAEARRLRAANTTPDAPTEVIPVVPGEDGASARVRLSTGQVVDLDRPVIIGRKPRSTRASGSTMPHLIAVDSPESDISRNHLEVRPEGDSVVVIDLHTTNGSTLLRPGSDPVRLHPGEQTLVLGGDVIDVGDGVTVLIEELT